MIASGSQNQLNHLSLLSVTFSRPSCSFRTWIVSILPPHLWFKGLVKGKVLSTCGRKRTLSDFITFFYLLVFVCCITSVFCFYFWVSLVLCFVLFNMFLFVYFQFFVYFFFDIKILKKNWKKSEKYKIVYVLCTLVLVYLGWPLKQSFLNFVSFVA